MLEVQYRMLRRFAWLLLVPAAGCAVGPEYHRATAAIPPAWQPDAPWHEAAPSDASLKGNWWELFGDNVLNPLVEQALANNQNLKVSAARLEQARAQVIVAKSYLYPEGDATASGARARISANRPLNNYATPGTAVVQNNFALGPYGKLRTRLVRSDSARGRRLSGGGGAGGRGFREHALAARQRSGERLLDLARARLGDRRGHSQPGAGARRAHLHHVASRSRVCDRSRFGAAASVGRKQRGAIGAVGRCNGAQNEHAVATLAGTPAPGFSIAPLLTLGNLPSLPLGLPSDLLQRRPDVASAERAMAAANARIGVARAAYFPTIQLGPVLPNFGWESTALGTLFNAPSQLWSFGLSATQRVFDAGRTRANVRIAEQDYTASVATYRQTVLTAMEEVENGITGLAALDRAVQRANASVESAQRAFTIASERYKGGVAIYLDVLTAQQTLLGNQRQAVQIHGQQFLTAVYLVKALGGGWQDLKPAVSRVD